MDINTIEILHVENSSINSLSGIEGFVSLKEIYCGSNPLLSLDFSGNLQLEKFMSSDNPNLESINLLNNTKLEVFGFNDPFNQVLDNVNFSNCLLLKSIEVTAALETIDVSNNILLETLHCSGNLLFGLDLGNNINLKSLDVANHSYEFGNLNNISGIDLSTNLELEYLNISSNPINEIDVSNNINLQSFICRTTSLTSVDLSQNASLTYFDCSTNFYPAINGLLEEIDIRNDNNELMTFFNSNNNSNLTCIYVDDVQYSTNNWTQIDDASNFVETQAQCNAIVSTEDLLLENSIVIYPNPVNQELYIDGSLFSNYYIYNIAGKRIASGQLEIGTNIIDFNILKKGLYFLKIRNGASIITKKIVKK